MKTDYEMYQNVLSRFNEHQRKKKRRITMIKRTISFAACFAVIFSGYRIWSDIPRIQQPPVIEDSSTNEKEPSTQNSSTQTTTVLQTSGQDKNIVTKATEDNSDLTVTTNSEETKVITSAATEINTMPRVEVVTTAHQIQTAIAVTKKSEMPAMTRRTSSVQIQTTVYETEEPQIPTTTHRIPAPECPISPEPITTQLCETECPVSTEPITTQPFETTTTQPPKKIGEFTFEINDMIYKSGNPVQFVEENSIAFYVDTADVKFLGADGIEIYNNAKVYFTNFDSTGNIYAVYIVDEEEERNYYVMMYVQKK